VSVGSEGPPFHKERVNVQPNTRDDCRALSSSRNPPVKHPSIRIQTPSKMVRQPVPSSDWGLSRRAASSGGNREPDDVIYEWTRRNAENRRAMLNRQGRLHADSRSATRNGRRSSNAGSGGVGREVLNDNDKGSSSNGKKGYYEKEMERKAKKEAKLERIRKEMMEEYTFTPKTLHSSCSTSRTTTTKGSSDANGVMDQVFERLYRHSGNVGTPLKGRSRTGSSGIHPIPNSAMSRTSSACSSRIEELYQEGKRKIRSRRLTDKQERDLREQRQAQREVKDLTFHPKTQWGSRVDPTKYKGYGRIGISPRHHHVHAPPVNRKKHSTPPGEILVRSPSHQWTPPRNQTHTSDYTMVSPLHDPSVVDDGMASINSTLLPRIHIGSTVGTSTVASFSQLTQTDETEYGSI
jgi:hypothetical protein